MGTYSDLLKQKPATKSVSVPVKKTAPKSTSIPTRKDTIEVTPARNKTRKISRAIPRENSRDWPTRDEIQEFSFRLRDELKVKVQAEVPQQWQDELEEIARLLKVKKLELYRFIIGEFLGRVKRKNRNS